MKKFLYLIICALFVACGNSNNNYKPCKHFSDNNVESETKISYETKICSKCGGVGTIEATIGDKAIIGLFTFGLGALVDTKECEICKGKGYVKIAVINQKDSIEGK